MKKIMEDKFGFPKELTEEVNDFGMPLSEVDEKKEPEVDHKKCLEELMAAVEMHLAIIAGQADEGEVDPLPETMQKIKDLMSPPKEEGPEEKPKSEMEGY